MNQPCSLLRAAALRCPLGAAALLFLTVFTVRPASAQTSPATAAAPADPTGTAPAPTDQIVVLNPFTVQSESAGYKVSNMTSATRLNTSIDDIPQNVSIISSDLMTDIGAFELRDAFEYTPGVTQRQNSPDAQVIYGFTNSLRYENGFSSRAGSTDDFTSDTSYIDRVEIIKGPAAAIAGQSAAAGYVNIVTKQPVAQDFLDASVTVASYNYVRAVVDTGGTVYKDPNQTVMFRFVAAGTDGDGFRDNSEYKIASFYPAVTWKLGDSTSLTAEAILLDSTTPSDIGSVYFPGNYSVPPGITPAFNNSKATWAPQSLSVNEPGENLTERPSEIFATFEHDFNSHISFRDGMVYRTIYTNYDRANEGVAPTVNGVEPLNYDSSVMYIDATTGQLMYARVHNLTTTNVSEIDNQGDLFFKYDFFGLNNRDDIGYIYSKTRYTQTLGAGAMTALNVFNPQYGVTPSPITSITSDLTKDYGSAWSWFLNHQTYALNDHLIATVGLRWDEGYEINQTNNLTGLESVTPATPTVLSKMFALTARPVSWLSFYGTYSYAGAPTGTALLYPSASVSAAGQENLVTTPTTLDREYGAKSELLNGKLSLTLTHFDIIAEDTVLNEVDALAPGGKIDVIEPGNSAIGWELAANGYLTDHLQFIGGYDYVTTHYPLGTQQSGTPLHKYVGLLNYGFRDYKNNPWHLKFGFLTESETYGTSAAGTGADLWRFPGETQLDTGFDYTRDGWTLEFWVRNITNVVFVEYGGDQTSNTVNSPREFMATISHRW